MLTTAGGWGVVTIDAIARDAAVSSLMQLPADLQAADRHQAAARWSRNNPVDCAGGETRDTIPEVMEMIAAHPDVHAVIYLGLGIQSNQARLMREGRFYPDHGLERIVAYHERQDERFAEAADELSRRYDKPILVATELAVADPVQPGPGDRARHRPALLRQRQPRRDRARRISSVRAVPSPTRARLMVARRVNPIAVLVVLAVIPAARPCRAVAIRRRPSAGTGRSAGRHRDPASLPGRNDHAVALGASRPRRAVARGQRRRALQNALQPLLASVDDNRCFALAIDGQQVAAKNESIAAGAGEQPEDHHRGRCSRRARPRLHLHHQGRRQRWAPMAWSTAICTSSAVATRCWPASGGTATTRNGRRSTRRRSSHWPTPFSSRGHARSPAELVGDGSRYDDEFYAPTWADADHVTAGRADRRPAGQRLLADTAGSSAKDPALGAATVLAQLLVDRGITVGEPSTGIAAGGATIAEVQSQPLSAILAEMLTTSDNNTAEMMLKEIGYKAKGQGTRTPGLQVVMERLAAWGVPTVGVIMVDGSGLSDANRVTCAAILGVLEHGSATDAVGPGNAGGGCGRRHACRRRSPIHHSPGGCTARPVRSIPTATPGSSGRSRSADTCPRPGEVPSNSSFSRTAECIAKDYRSLWDQLGQALAPYPSGPTAETLAPR